MKTFDENSVKTSKSRIKIRLAKMWLNNKILQEILYKKNTVCCLCFNVTGEDAWSVDDEIYLHDSDVALKLANIFESVFENKISDFTLFSYTACEECVKSAINAYKFIKKCINMNNIMTNTLCNLEKVTCKYDTRAKGMYIVADPNSFDSKVYYDSRKTATTVTTLLKRLQNFVTKGENENVRPSLLHTQCDLCGLVLKIRNLPRHRQLCLTKIKNKQIKSETNQSNEINNDVSEIKQGSETETMDNDNDLLDNDNDLWLSATERKSMDNDNDLLLSATARKSTDNDNDLSLSAIERRKAQKRMYLKKLERVSCKHCGTSVANRFTLNIHMIKNCKSISAIDRESLVAKREAFKAERKRMKEKNEIIKQSNKMDVIEDDKETIIAMKKARQKLYLESLERVSCEHCGNSLRNKFRLQKHQINNCKAIKETDKEMIIKQRNAIIARREALKKKYENIKSEGGRTRPYLLEKIKCKFCGMSTKGKYTMKKHLRDRCKALTETERRKASAEYSVANQIRPHRKFRRILKIRQTLHTLVKEIKSKKEKQKACCFYCDQSFQSKTLLSKHIYTECKNTPAEVKYTICSQCGKTIPRNKVKSHEKTHTTQFVCDKCGKIFKSQKGYGRHLKVPNCLDLPLALPPKEKKHYCHVCGKLYSSQSSLRQHVLLVHTKADDNPFTCMFCGKLCGSNHSLRTHLVVHTKEKNFECEICGGRFVSKHSLLYHTRTHTGEKPYSCQICDSRFLSASRLNIHKRLKHMAPQLECKYCLKKFKGWGHLSRHRKRHFNPNSSLYMESLDPTECLPLKTTRKADTTIDSEDESLSS